MSWPSIYKTGLIYYNIQWKYMRLSFTIAQRDILYEEEE